MRFYKEFRIQINGSFYDVSVDGSMVRDEHDRDKYYSMPDSWSAVDEDGNPVDELHDDYDDLAESIESQDYEPDHWG